MLFRIFKQSTPGKMNLVAKRIYLSRVREPLFDSNKAPSNTLHPPPPPIVMVIPFHWAENLPVNAGIIVLAFV